MHNKWGEEMSRYIDAEWLKQNFNTVFWSQITKTIDSAPSIDIVRCRECKYAEVSVSPITGLWCTRFGINDMAMEADDFCSYGERKESE